MTEHETAFIKQFERIAPHYRRSEVFYDFITIFALEMYLGLYRDQADSRLMERYWHAIRRYDTKERQALCQLFACFVGAMEKKSYDFLGTVFMVLNLGDDYKGQYFTPDHVAQLMASTQIRDCDTIIQQTGFITINEPTCGSGVMLVACANALRAKGLNPQQQMWVQAQDIDFTAAMMCYLQLNLLGIPGEIIIGDALTEDTIYHLYTFGHILGNWDKRLAYHTP
ncbi:N-6 DNA methylase [Conservatibacter flavescens]|uniref:site-specific DNA-methyltransferase (adenine-specific) n=1 Tax=Conservatibacter flavescens TaxID=28161 RepID=A0A2M8S116_9PAST|nr:N-6 DNA methylase [Conservatibacter flavescens]PJG84825.1 restriction endonuclease subunit M [Conservatibacter flavescens]